MEPFPHIERKDIAVLGGGIIGLSAAYAAATRGGDGVRVRLYEAANVGHSAASSSDVSRVFRHLNGPNPLLTSWAIEASSLWDQLSAEGGRPLLRRTGVLFLAHQDSGVSSWGHHVWPYKSVAQWMDDSSRVLVDKGIPHQRITPRQLEGIYPQFQDPTLEEAVLDNTAGFLEAATALETLLDLCLKAGVEYHPNSRVKSITSDGDGCTLELENGPEVKTQATVMALNGWTGDLLPFPPGTLALAEQPLIYLDPRSESSALARIPVFISLNTDCYGFPVQDGLLKIANDNPYRPIDHPDQRKEAENEYVEAVVGTVARFLPAVKDAKVSKTHVCFYDRSRNELFILDAWDRDSRVVYGCGMSGRAFKFAPVIGERLARFAVTGRRPEDIESFRLR